jgi:hypothetical protein
MMHRVEKLRANKKTFCKRGIMILRNLDDICEASYHNDGPYFKASLNSFSISHLNLRDYDFR